MFSPNFINLDFLHPHSFPNTPKIKNKSIKNFFAKKQYRFFITLSINISVFFFYTKKPILLNILKILKEEFSRGAATNNGLGGRGWQVQIGIFFCIVSTNVVQESLLFLHRVNNVEDNIKQNIYTDMEVISLIPP